MSIIIFVIFVASMSLATCQINQPPSMTLPNQLSQSIQNISSQYQQSVQQLLGSIFNGIPMMYGQMPQSMGQPGSSMYQVLPSMPNLPMIGLPQMLTLENLAVAILSGNSGVRGVVIFYQNAPGGPVKITGNITGLQPGSTHGFHIHQYGDLSNGCMSMGGHFNPFNKTHGDKTDINRHVGDLGNVMADQTGVVQLNMDDLLLTLTGPLSIAGRGVVVHQLADDLGKTDNPDSLITGNAGARIACGVIGLSKSK